jgi:hypothetical protein
MEAVSVGVGVVHAWHFLAWYSESLPRWQRYDLFGRGMVAAWGVLVGVLPAIVPQAGPRVCACWLLAQVVDIVGHHALPAPNWFPLVVMVGLVVTLAVPYARLACALACGVWLGLMWQWRLAWRFHDEDRRHWWVWTVFSVGVAGGMVGSISDFFPHPAVQMVAARGGVLSAFCYTLLFTGRFLPKVYASPARGVPSGEPAHRARSEFHFDGVGESLAARAGVPGEGRSGSEVPGDLDDYAFDWGSAFSGGWSGSHQDEAGDSGLLHQG